MHKRFVAATILVLGVLCNGIQAEQKSDVTCIVIPARYTVVQFAFDVLRLRQSVYIVSYDRLPNGGAVVMHIWNDKMQEWQKMSAEEYAAGSAFTQTPGKYVIVGGEKDVPAEVSTTPAGAADVHRIASLDLVTLINNFHEIYKFNQREWKWLASRYGIKYEDLNAERRRWGRYGKPGSENTAAAAMPGARVEGVVEGPAEIVTSPDLIEDKPLEESKPMETSKPALVAPEDK